MELRYADEYITEFFDYMIHRKSRIGESYNINKKTYDELMAKTAEVRKGNGDMTYEETKYRNNYIENIIDYMIHRKLKIPNLYEICREEFDDIRKEAYAWGTKQTNI